MLNRTSIRRYVSQYMPIEELSQFLTIASSLHPDDALQLREFNLGFAKADTEIGYSRFHNFKSAEELRNEISRRAPARVDVGGILTTQTMFMALGIGWKDMLCVEKELVIDIDIDDYNDVRGCQCVESKAKSVVCRICWGFLAIAAKTVEFLLRNKFGCHELFWVFSGRRGIHCWVLDRDAARFSDKYRKAILRYFQPFDVNPAYKTSKDSSTTCYWVNLENYYPGTCKLIKKLYDDLLLDQFEKLLHSDALDLRSRICGLYIVKTSLTGHKTPLFAHALLNAIKPNISNIAIWNQYKMAIRNNHPAAETLIMSIVLSFVFPRLDGAVTTNRKHLLKCPYSWHPTTGNICVPLTLSKIDRFNLATVPNIKEWYNFENFYKWMKPLNAVLLDRCEIALKYVCMDCVDISRPIGELPKHILFDLEEDWMAHIGEKHTTTQHTLRTSHIFDLVRILCNTREGVDRDTLKRSLYSQLESSL